MAMAHKKSQGERVGSVPWGKTVAEDGKTLVTSETDKKLIARAKRLHREGKSVRAIAAKLAEQGYKTRRGAPMNKSTVHELLHL